MRETTLIIRKRSQKCLLIVTSSGCLSHDTAVRQISCASERSSKLRQVCLVRGRRFASGTCRPGRRWPMPACCAASWPRRAPSTTSPCTATSGSSRGCCAASSMPRTCSCTPTVRRPPHDISLPLFPRPFATVAERVLCLLAGAECRIPGAKTEQTSALSL